MSNKIVEVRVVNDCGEDKIEITELDGGPLHRDSDRMIWRLKGGALQAWEISLFPKEGYLWPFEEDPCEWKKRLKRSGRIRPAKEIPAGTYKYGVKLRLRRDHEEQLTYDPDIVIDDRVPVLIPNATLEELLDVALSIEALLEESVDREDD